MASVWAKWQISTGDHFEITINDVLGEARLALGQYTCEGRDKPHGGKAYIVTTSAGRFVLCRRCCEKLGLPSR